MLELFTVLMLLDRWVIQALRGKLEFVGNPKLRSIRTFIVKARGDPSSEQASQAIQSLRQFDYAGEALKLLCKDSPPEEYDELKYVLFKAGITLHGKPIHGMQFLEEVISRLQVLYRGEDEDVIDLQGVDTLPQALGALCTRRTSLSSVTTEFGMRYQDWLENWRTEGIWVQTCSAQIYQD